MMDGFMAPCPFCDEMFEDTDEFFEHYTTCELSEGEDDSFDY